MTSPLVVLDKIAIRQRDRWLLRGLSWRIHAGEQWAVVGPNGAGKTTLAKAIAGLLPVVQGKIDYPLLGDLSPLAAIAYVASDARRDLWRSERRLSHARDFSGHFDAATRVRQTIGSPLDDHLPTPEVGLRLAEVARRLHLEHLLEKPILSLSTGEMSRVLIARQLIRRPRMLILDEPFEGLDTAARQALVQMLDRLAAGGLPILLITHRSEELLPATTHILRIDDRQRVTVGPLDRSARLFGTPAPASGTPDHRRRDPLPAVDRPVTAATQETLIEMQAVTVRYGDTVVLDRFSWSVQAGEHWAITGPNGAGKSTILKLITGDCLQVYANRIRLFGAERGPDQTLGEVRECLGVVSSDLATAYQKKMSALDVVCSGFFDSVGLYRYCDAAQVDTARRWLAMLGISDLSRTPFNQLSQGQRQMILIARSMVKSPRLLILDEPCAGLDAENRSTVLDCIERIGRRGTTGLVFVSHHEREIPPCTTHRLVLDRGQVVACRARDEWRPTREEGRRMRDEG